MFPEETFAVLGKVEKFIPAKGKVNHELQKFFLVNSTANVYCRYIYVYVYIYIYIYINIYIYIYLLFKKLLIAEGQLEKPT